MKKEQEYINFWTSVMNKIDEIEKDYGNLSDENKHRVDSAREAILHAHTSIDAVQIIRSQMN